MSSSVQKGNEYRSRAVRGDTFVLDLTFRLGDPNTGTPMDMTGDTWRFTVRHSRSDSVVAEITSADGGISLNHVSTGRLYATIPKEVTAGWPVGVHKIDLERTTAAGVRTTYLSGILVVSEDQSR